MKTFSLLKFAVLFGITFQLSTLCFSQFENTIGNLVGSDESSDIKPLPNGHTIMLANSTSFGADKILLTELDAAGHPVFFKSIFDPANFNEPYTGNSIELDLDAAGNPSGYFITGCKGAFPTKMIVLRTDLNGNPTWARQMDGGSDPNSLISECGISIERQPNRDIIVVGRSDQLGDLRFIVSRLSSAGVLIWSFRYGTTTGFQFLPNESCNGMRNHEEVVAVVGHVHDTMGIGHTYLSCIKASNGMEFWRNQYTSDHYHDDGTDVVQRPADQRYFIEGHAENLGGGGTELWTIVANGNNGNLSSSSTYSLLPPFQSLFGRDLCFNPLDGTVAITGYITVESSFEPAEIRTFIWNMPFVAGAVPNFSHYFRHSEPEPFLFADDAIEFFGGPNPGYVIGTQAILPGSAPFDYDLHALRLNTLGRHNLADCPIVLFTPEINPEGTMDRLKKNKTPSTWSNLALIAIDQDFIEDPCIGPIIAPPENVFQTIPAFSGEAALYPNPASAGGEINLRFEMTESSEVSIEIFDITGRQVYQLRRWQDEGQNLIRFSLPSDLSEKLYAVKLGFCDGQNKVLRLLIE